MSSGVEQGMDISLNAVRIEKTYLNWFVGGPTAAGAIKTAERKAEEWTHSPVHVEQPTLTVRLRKDEKTREWLPEWQFIAWVEGDATAPDEDRASAALVWWADSPSFEFKLVLEILSKLEWSQISSDFCF